jgi:ribosomal protein S18 acetylase RimI-like enzyme
MPQVLLAGKESKVNIRSYQPRDLPALYRICLATGAAGSDASELYRDPLIVGHVYAAPYALFCPESCFVAEDNEGICGYIVGTSGTQEFEQRLEAYWWPELRGLYAVPVIGLEPLRFDRLIAYLIHNPFRTPERISSDYPAHLHINLLPRAQARGIGRALTSHWLLHMWERGAAGAHLAVGTANPRAIAFYRRYGFAELERTGRDGHIVWFGIKP